MFNDLVVPKLDDNKQIILDLRYEIGHFRKGHILVEVNKPYF